MPLSQLDQIPLYLNSAINLLQALLPFLVTITVPFLLPLFKDIYLWLHQSLATNKHSLLMKVCSIAVLSVEQILRESDSTAKKQTAVDCVDRILSEYGIRVSPAVTSAMIESIVNELNQPAKIKAPSPPGPSPAPQPNDLG